MEEVAAEHESHDREMNLEEKRRIAKLWSDAVLGVSYEPDVESLSNAELRENMYGALMDEVTKVNADLGISLDTTIVEQIQNAKNPDERAAHELACIDSVQRQINEYIAQKRSDAGVSDKWDSWPTSIREHERYNCLGGTMLGVNLLEQAGIKVFHGMPSGHSVGVARLSNGDVWYIDFINGGRNVQKIDVALDEQAPVAGYPIDNPQLDYRYIGIAQKESIVGSILSNVATLAKEANDPDIPEYDLDKQAAKSFYQRHADAIDGVVQNDTQSFLERENQPFYASEEMRRERERIDSLFSIEDPITAYVQGLELTPDTQQALHREMKENVGAIRDVFYHDASIPTLSDIPTKIIWMYVERLQGLRERNPEHFYGIVDRFINRISS